MSFRVLKKLTVLNLIILSFCSQAIANTYLWCEQTGYKDYSDKDSAYFMSFEIRKGNNDQFEGVGVSLYKFDDTKIIEDINWYRLGYDNRSFSGIIGDYYTLSDPNKEVFSLYEIYRYATDSVGKKRLLNESNKYPSVEPDFYNRYLGKHFKEENYLAMTVFGESRYFYMCWRASKNSLSQKIQEMQEYQNKFNEKLKLKLKKAEKNKI
jgi:hypothetical protein